MTSDRPRHEKKRRNVDVSRRQRSATGSIFDTVATLDEQDDDVPSRRATDDHDHDHDLSRRQCQTAAVQAQTNIYSKLMECRILWQRSLTQLSPPDAPTTATNEAFTDAALHQCDDILIKLLEARRLLSQPSRPHKANDDDDDDDDDPMDVDEVDYGALIKESPVAFQERLQKEYEEHRGQWKEVLNRRHYHVQLHSGAIQHKKFNMIDTSFWHLVQSTLQHLQMRHNNHNNNSDGTATPSLLHHSGYQPFDDSKIYQQMLKDFVETASNTTDPNDAAGIRKRHKTSSNKNKAMVDRKASKGRKIRYTTMTKLTNFTFPIQRRHTSSTTTTTLMFDEDAWYRSLFGGT